MTVLSTILVLVSFFPYAVVCPEKNAPGESMKIQCWHATDPAKAAVQAGFDFFAEVHPTGVKLCYKLLHEGPESMLDQLPNMIPNR